MDLSATIACLGALVLERVQDRGFVRRGIAPTWTDVLGRSELSGTETFTLDDVFPFLSVFLPAAQASWHAGGDDRADSGFWTERGRDGQELHLEAAALRVGKHPLLIVSRNERLFAQQQLVLQRARELRLIHSQLVRETEQKDVLIHCIVHDLAVPLHSILGALSLLAELPLGAEAKRWMDLGVSAATRQRQLIRDILEVFAAEYRGMDGGADSLTTADLRAAIAVVSSEAEPLARILGATVHVEVGEGPWQVVADDARLVRVLGNLVTNALEHSPRGAQVTLSLTREEGSIRVNVDDEGVGVAPEFLPQLFERFSTGRRLGDGTGLGLYFCRITVERWRGGIGYERREPKGGRFWIRLLTVESPSAR